MEENKKYRILGTLLYFILRIIASTLKIEVVKERGANLLARLYHYQNIQGIEVDDESNPWIVISDDLSDLIHTNIYLVNSFEELERYVGYLDGIERMISITEKRMVA